MARAARTASVIVALLCGLAAAPSLAAAAIVGTTTVTLPSAVTVGQTATATITLTNANTGSEEFVPNVVCADGEAAPCDGNGILLLPACGMLSGIADCFPGKEDAGVFAATTVAFGVAGTECAGATFGVSVADPVTGKLLIAPAPETIVTLMASGSICKIDVPLGVVGMPEEDQDFMVDGVQTRQIASATQKGGAEVSSSAGTVSTTVSPAQPTIATTASGSVALGAGTISDTATVSGRVSPVLGATVEFKLFGPGDTTCTTPISTTSAPVSDTGTATSPAVSPTQVGTYRWIASYSGDDNNAAVSGACNDPGESVTVTAAPPARATPTIGVAASPGIVIGGQISATAGVGGRVSPVAGATVLFRAFGPDDATCTSAPAFAAASAVSDAGLAASPPFTPASLQTGVYRWVASYSGDANNLPVASACGAPGSTVTVAPLPAQVVSAGFESTPRTGQTSFLTVAAFDPTQPITGLKVRFGEPRGLSGVSACRLAGFGIARSPVRLRLPFTFRRSGRHRITIVILSGGCGGKLTTSTSTIDVDVAGGQATRGAFAAARSFSAELGAHAAQSSCANRFLRPGSSAASRLKVATSILCLVNAERAKLGLRRLKRSRVLSIAAIGHSKDMLKRRFFEHAGPGGPSLSARLKRIRYRGSSAAENIAYGSSFNAKLVMQAWMNSPPHKANILSPRSRFLGIGIAVGVPVTPGRPGSTYTQDFGSSVK